MSQQANGDGEETNFDTGVRCMHERIRSSSMVVIVLAFGIIVPMAVDHSNSNKQQGSKYLATVLCAYFTVLSGLVLRLLVFEYLEPCPGRGRYIAIKVLVHACSFLLVSLSSTLSVMMCMNAAATYSTLATSTVFVVHQLRRCTRTRLEEDVDAYMGCEDVINQLVELSMNVMFMLFSCWFSMAFFYFQNHPAVETQLFLLPEYLMFFTSVAASLMFLKVVPGRQQKQSVRELMAQVCVLVFGVAATALAIAASKVRGYAALALLPEAVVLAAWFVKWAMGICRLAPRWPLRYDGAAQQGEPAPHILVGVLLTLLLSVLTYHAKDVDRALSSLYDEAFVLVTTAAVVAALGWRLLIQAPTPTEVPGIQAAAKILTVSTFCLLVLSVLTVPGVIFGW